MERLEDGDEVGAEGVLEGHLLAVDDARHEHHLLVLDVDALDRADALGEDERLRRRERLGRVEAAAALPDDRRVEALLDRRPDAEDRREGIAADLQVAAVADVDLVDLVEQVVRRIAGEDVGQARVHARAQDRQATGGLPLVVLRELVVRRAARRPG